MSKEELLLYKNLLTPPYTKDGYTWYEISFKSLYELYDYLIDTPPFNNRCFGTGSSQNQNPYSKEWYELSYDEAVKYLLGGYKVKIEDLLNLKQKLERGLEFPGIKRKTTKAVTGSRICPNSFITNDPKKYYRLERISEKKFITIHVNLAYSANHETSEILNRGAILHNLINILEENNYSVRLNTFYLISNYDEIIYIKINLKNINSPITISSSIYPLTSKAFFRRTIFRVMESLPVIDRSWGDGYGFTIHDEEVKKLLNLSEDDIYVGTPRETGVRGDNIYKDAERFLDYINMDKYVRVKVK